MPDDDASSIEIPLESRESLELEHARMDRNSGGPPVSDARAEDVAIEQNLRHQLYTKIASGRKRYLGQLLIHLDQFIIAQLIFMYYLDISFLRFLLRIFTQTILLSPLSLTLPTTTYSRPYRPLLVFSISICILSHLLLSLPKASKGARGYLHGGLIVDFIGQKSPSHELWLVAFDLVIAGLQLFMLTVHLEDERCTAALKSGEMKVMEAYMGGLDADLPGHPPIPTASEDENRPSIDLEEGDASVELQPLNPPQSAPSGNRTPRVYRTGPTSSAPDRPIPLTSINLSTPTLVSLFHALNSSQDIFWSGTYSLGSFHLRDTWMMLRAQDADRAVASGESVDPNSSLYLLSQAATNHAIRARTQMARAAGAGIGAR